MLLAPHKGCKTRKDLKNKLDELVNKAKNFNSRDVQKYIMDKVDEIKKDLTSLDKEQVVNFYFIFPYNFKINLP